jgi:acetylcholinesterase
VNGASLIYNASAIVGQSIVRVCSHVDLTTWPHMANLSAICIQGTPLVYVNYNYRLGPLGFPQGQEGELPLLSLELSNCTELRSITFKADDRKALNLALKDELAALEWVQQNIGYFGGDKTKVSLKDSIIGA